MKNLELLLIEVGKPPLDCELPNPTFDKLRKLLCCKTAEYIYCDDGKHVMVVDEEGFAKERLPNYYATSYRNVNCAAYRSGAPLLGNVAVVKLKDLNKIPYE